MEILNKIKRAIIIIQEYKEVDVCSVLSAVIWKNIRIDFNECKQHIQSYMSIVCVIGIKVV